ncbi:hypothetical protein BRC83_06845 [Halobacteriales archaeon QS_1_68_17]|nr:MAG: hypothetical protein BRC83_06845 [Halobacteriales archaeon QS_1_68_17]
MTAKQRFVDEQGPVEKYEYDDGTVLLVADAGAGSDASVDVVDGTVIVVTADDQYEFEVPADAADASIKNGVLTVEVSG